MNYNPYEDELFADRDTISTSLISEILFGYSWQELSALEIRLTSLKNVDRKSTATQLAFYDWIALADLLARQEKNLKPENWPSQIGGTKFVFDTEQIKTVDFIYDTNFNLDEKTMKGLLADIAKQNKIKPNSFDLKTTEKKFLLLLVAVEAYSFLSKLIGIKFHGEKYMLDYPDEYPTAEFFLWIDSGGVLKKLETQVKGFKTPTRAREFIGYLKKAHTTEKPAPERQKTGTEASIPKKEYAHGRADPGGLIQDAIQSLKDAGVRREVVHYHPDVLELLPNKDLSVDRNTKKDEYKEKTRISLSTIKGFIREIYNS